MGNLVSNPPARYIDPANRCQAMTLRYKRHPPKICLCKTKENYNLCGRHLNYIKRHFIQSVYELETMKKFNTDLFDIILRYY